MLLESCVNSALSAIEAQTGGAGRVELCENMYAGGCTPSHGTILLARKKLKIGLFVMIRPRGGDFLYSGDEYEIMQKDIADAKSLGADGVVFGILNPGGTIDKPRMAKLTGIARPMKVTCHRAFDMTSDPFQAMEDLIDLGIDRILTSGQNKNALLGAPLIKSLIEKSKGRIVILPGGGIKENNLKEILTLTGAQEVHMYLTKVAPSMMNFARKNISLGLADDQEYESVIVDAERIRAAKEIMNSPG